MNNITSELQNEGQRATMLIDPDLLHKQDKAWRDSFYCQKCGGKLRSHEVHFETICGSCKSTMRISERLKELSQLSLEQRIAKIEEWILRHEEGHALKEYIFS